MSRIGNSPIPLPKGVEVKVEGKKVFVKGPKGNLELLIRHEVEVKVEDGQVILTANEKVDGISKFHGLYRALIANMVLGVSEGFEKRLELQGVGYRAAVQGQKVDLQLGYSHPTQLDIPEGITVTVEKATNVVVSGADKQMVGQFAADIRAVRPPEVYKGKGVRYKNEYVRRKAGKTGKGK